MTLRSLLQQATLRLESLQRDAPRLSAEVLIADAMELSRLELLLRLDEPVDRAETRRIWSAVERRARGEPVAYIRGWKEFYGRDFFVSPGVLIPRPESELLIDLARDHFEPGASFRFADLCTGSGNLGLSLACERCCAYGVGTEISRIAASTALRNTARHGLGERFAVALASLGSCLHSGSLDLVLCNPPYLSKAEMDSVSSEVRSFEPVQALFGGREGLEVPLRALPSAARTLKPWGLLFMETGPAQGKALLEAARAGGQWQELRLHRDLAGKDRVLFARRCGV